MCLQREHLPRTSSDLVLFFLEDDDITRIKCWLRFRFVFFWSKSFVIYDEVCSKPFYMQARKDMKKFYSSYVN